MPRWVQNPHTGKLVPSHEVDWPREPRGNVVSIMPDIESFVSPVDGSVITSRSRLREHNARNDVVNIKEFDGVWEAAEKKRRNVLAGKDKEDVEARKKDVIAAYEQVKGS